MKLSLLAALQETGSLTVAFQPVFELVDRPNPIHALAASIRGPQGTHFENPALLLEYIRRKKAEPLIDRAVLSAVCRAVEVLPQNMRIHLPVHVSTIAQNPGFVSHLESQAKQRGLHPERLTIELIHNGMCAEQLSIGGSIDALRQLGARIGLSGVGLGNPCWRVILDRSPEYWKLDAYLVEGVSADFKKRVAVEALQEMAKRLGGSIVATGVGNAEDLATLAMLGVQLVQADFLCQAISLEALLRSGVLTETIDESQGRCHIEESGPMLAE
jgi:EAL domain-containing protein (putative c-di-GMP-specific phosphodiesterase class I)